MAACWGQELKDRFQDWSERRHQNRLQLFERAGSFLHSREVQPSWPPPKLLGAILEFSTQEEDKTLQEKWAALLASAMTPTGGPTVLPSFPDILSKFTVADAWLLDWCYSNACAKNRNAENYATPIGGLQAAFRDSPLARAKEPGIDTQWNDQQREEFWCARKEDDGDYSRALDSLLSTRLLEQRQEAATEYQPAYMSLLLTPLGFCLAAACQPGLRDIYPDDIDEW